MSLYDYRVSAEIRYTDPPFYALIMAAIRKADTINTAKLRAVFPDTYAEFEARYHAPGGILPEDNICLTQGCERTGTERDGCNCVYPEGHPPDVDDEQKCFAHPWSGHPYGALA